MSTKFRRITLKELEPVVQYYQSQLPGWTLIRRATLVRMNGPVLQGITFDRLSYGAYRPVGYIRILTAPEVRGGMELPQFLDAKMSIRLGEHERVREKIVDAMRHEFAPNITRPLDPFEVLKLCERKAIPTSPEAYSLATLNAYLGKKERALYWCSRFNKLVDALKRPWGDEDKERRAYLDLLEKWISEGTEKQHLEEVMQREREKWSI
jgi:hypothetical protein